MNQPRRLLSFEYISLLGIILLVFCNIAVFYNLYNYLGELGIPGDLRGLLIGVFSLISMPLFLFASPFINHYNATRLMLLGLFALAACGVAYLFVDSFWGLLALRSLNGAAMFCLSASSLALLVWVIPEEKSGQGFAIYSSAILIPYAMVPMVVDALEPWIASASHTYAVMAALLIPAAAVVLVIRKRQRAREGGGDKPSLPSWEAIRKNLTRRPVAVMLAAQCFYFMNFSGLFFMFKGFAQVINLGNVGHFFGVQMALMLAIRTLGSSVFDRLNKGVLLDISFLMTALGYLALSFTSTPAPVTYIALLFGLGLGLGYPALNSLMYLYSEPRFRALNANLMMMALHLGYFIGPVLAGSLVNHTGYRGFLLAWMGLNLTALTFCALLLRDPSAGKKTTAKSGNR